MRNKLYNALRLGSAILFVWICLEASAPLLFSDTVSANAHQVLRLHIVANSDNAQDQRVKLLVRDALLEQFAPSRNIQEAEEILLQNGGGVLEVVERVLKEQGCDYGAQLRFGIMDFPNKSYGGTVYPAGEYEALRIELGDAAGRNWWCVLFPPICLLDIGVTDIENSDELVFESDILRLIKG